MRWIKPVLYFLLAATINVVTAADDPARFKIPIERHSTNFPVISVFYQVSSHAIDEKLQQKVILCAWNNGRIVWSKDRLKGGPPYFESRVDPKQIAVVMERLDQKRIFERAVWLWWQTDAGYHEAYVAGRNRSTR